MEPISVTSAREAGHPHRIAPLFATEPLDLTLLAPSLRPAAAELARVREFGAKPSQTLLLPQGERQWLLVGLGEREKLTRPLFCEAVAQGLAALREAGGRNLSLFLPAGLPWGAEATARFATEAIWMAGYTFDFHRTRNRKSPLAAVELVHGGDPAATGAGIAQGEVVGRAIALTRDLINQPASIAHPGYVIDQAREVARRVGAHCREIGGEALAQEGYGAIHAVGRAGAHPPALVALEHAPDGAELPTLALVGKGVTFDSGGLDLKPSTAMALMKKDLGGAAIVLGAFQALAELRKPLRLVAVLGLAENLVGPLAYKPGDILRSKAGLTIEITNTDAEGRLVLADALALARSYGPRYLVDFATLTGACRTALGKEVMGLFCNDEPLTQALRRTAEETGDALWPLPLWEPYRKKLESPVADLINATTDGFAGAITAALFLSEFAGTVAWAHLDCYAWSDGDSPLHPKGGSGVGVRLAVELAERLIQASRTGDRT